MGVQTFLIGLISGLISSLCFFLVLQLIKPKIEVSPDICKQEENGDTIFKIKIVNRSRYILIGLQYELCYCTTYQDGTRDYEEIKPKYSQILAIDEYKKDDDDASYAIRLSYCVPEEKYPILDTTKFVFTIVATHSVSNAIKCVHREYTNDKIKTGRFETGISMKILLDRS